MAKIKADGQEYEVPAPATLGELREIKRHYGVTPVDFGNVTDPDVLSGLLFISAKRGKAAPDDYEILKWIDGITAIEFIADEDDAEAADPTKAADEAASDESAPSVTTDSNPATTPANSGTRDISASTESTPTT